MEVIVIVTGWKEMFQTIDTDNSGQISFKELEVGLKRFGATLDEPEIYDLMQSADIDNNGTIDYREFIAATLHFNKIEREDHLLADFSYFDKDGSGVACDEFGIEEVQLEDMIREADQNNFDNQSPLSFMDGFSIVSDTKISNISNFDNLSPEGASSAFPSTAPTPLTDETNRETKILRYKEKRKARKFEKKIRYTSRKAQAHNRGKFAKRPQLVPELDRMLSFEEFAYGIVPS
ncbi:hypothetical protein RJ639_042137 [Escallonia herrerae]|uniref:Uncharacterized protein n=1 Tax=Escallonia herrerae TaxID=1293975 RepID=A0AA88WID5_9ASTE|nr:hypothetical protein RJ639_042137 [Escallonia herrerae]